MDSISQPTTDADVTALPFQSLKAKAARLGSVLLPPEGRAPEIADGVPEETYFAIEAVSNSAAKHAHRSALHVAAAILGFKPDDEKKSQIIGKRAHRCLLEPELYREEVRVGPDVSSRNTKEWKAFERENEGFVCLKPKEALQLQNMIEAILNHKLASQIIRGGKRERVVIARCPRTGLLRKTRWDFDSEDDYAFDYKTAEDAGIEAFERNAAAYGYPNQGAFYLDVGDDAGLKRKHFMFLVQEKDPPYAVAVYVYDGAVIEKAREMNNRRMDKVKYYAQNNLWLGYPEAVQTLYAPSYFFEKEI